MRIKFTPASIIGQFFILFVAEDNVISYKIVHVKEYQASYFTPPYVVQLISDQVWQDIPHYICQLNKARTAARFKPESHSRSKLTKFTEEQQLK